MTRPARRLWLVDHMLKGVIGHHLGYNLALAGAAGPLGWQPAIVTHRDLDERLARGHDLLRLFRTDWRTAPPAWIARRITLLRLLEKLCAARFATDLKNLRPGSDDILFVQMIAPRHFLAWIRWASARPVPVRLALHLGYQPHRFVEPRLKNSLKALPDTVRRKIVFVTDSELLTGPFESALEAPVHYLPHVVEREFPSAPARPEGGPLRFLSLGNARREKGFADIARTARLLAKEREEGRIHLTIQCHQPDAESAALLAGESDGPGLRWIRRPLSDEEYAAELSAADGVLLPYHRDHYALRTSGVFCEARGAGKPIVGSDGSWLGGRIARDGGGWLVPERDPAALANCLREIPHSFPQVAEDAARLAPAAAAEFCPRTFVRQLLELCNREST